MGRHGTSVVSKNIIEQFLVSQEDGQRSCSSINYFVTQSCMGGTELNDHG